MAKHSVLGLITARGGSKGLPGKNMKPLLGCPLVDWTIEAAKNSQSIHRLVVSTDDIELANFCCARGCEVPFLRPEILATDTASHIDVVNHALDFLQEEEHYSPSYIVVLQPTSPLRTADDIDTAVLMLKEHNADAVISVYKPHHHPYIAKTLDNEGRMHDLIHSFEGHPRRQDMPTAYMPNGAIFALNVTSYLTQRKFYMHNTLGYIMDYKRSIDIDTQYDFDVAEISLNQLLNKNAR